MDANDSADHGAIAPRLPTPNLPEGASPNAFLRAARTALSGGRTGLAEEALERAQTRALDRTQIGYQPVGPMTSEMSSRIDVARSRLQSGDRAATLAAIDEALALAPTKTSSNDAQGMSPAH